MKPICLIPVLLLVTLCLVSTAGAFEFMDGLAGGSTQAPLPARAMAMAGSGIADAGNGYSILSNPATLGLFEQRTVRGGLWGLMVHDQRSFTAIDTWESSLTDNIYAQQRNYAITGDLAATWSFGKGLPTVGLAFGPTADLSFDYRDEIRSSWGATQDELAYQETWKDDGMIDALSYGVGYAYDGKWSIGVGGRYLFGSWSRAQAVRSTDSLSTSHDWTLYQKIQSLRGMDLTVGLAVRPVERITLGAFVRVANKFSGDFNLQGTGSLAAESLSGDFAMHYPSVAGFGLTYRPPSPLLAQLNVDVVFTGWHNAGWDVRKNDSLIFDQAEMIGLKRFDDSWALKVGLESRYLEWLPLRFGFRIEPSRLRNQDLAAGFSLGAGSKLGPVTVDVAVDYATISYRWPDLFPDSYVGGTDRPTWDKVGSSLTTLKVDVGYAF